MSYKTGRGNVAKKCLRFHATVKMVFDYQQVTAYPVAASRRCKRSGEGVAVSRLRRNTSVLWRILIVALVTLRSVVW